MRRIRYGSIFSTLFSPPLKHVSTVRQDRAKLLYALIKGCSLNVGKIVERSILDCAENNFSRNIPHLALITLLCIKGEGRGGGGGGVTFSKTEEKYPRDSPLTLTRVLKTATQGEEVERARKRKREATELPMEATPTDKEEPETEEMRGFEDYPEQ